MPKLTSLFAATTLIAGITAGYLWQQLHTALKLTAQLQQELAMQSVRRAPVTHAIEPVVANQPMPAVPAESTTRTIPPPAGMPAATAAGITQNARVSISQSALRNVFPDLDKELGLNPQEADSLVQLMLRNAQQAEIEALIGPARAQQLQEYQKTLESRRRMNELKNTLAQSSFPLTDEQMDRIAPMSRAEQVRRDENLRARIRPTDPRAQLDFDEETIKATEASYGRVIAVAKSVLTPEQLGIMQNSMNSVVTSQRTSLQARRARLAAGGSGAEAAPIPAGSGAQTPFIIITQPGSTGQTIPAARP